MNSALIVIDYTENCCLEEYRDHRLNLGLSRVRDIAISLDRLITYYRTQHIGEVIWIRSCPWIQGHVHPHIERFYRENPEAEFYSCKHGGTDFYRIKPALDEKIFEKNLYSAFAGTQRKLDEYLRKQNMNRLTISGIYSTGCVNATICEAFHLGYRLTIIRDGVETFDDSVKQAYQRCLFDDWSVMYGRVMDLSQYIKSIESL